MIEGVRPPIQGRKVIDRTEVTCQYDFSLDFARETTSHPSAGDDDSSIFTAVQEQLALRLVAAKAIVAVLVVD